ncbi:hypothetical protein FFONT_0664 [Fervidicoccus fontis Kam940]|uniref:Uncharacterized protein n=1 Tax=Fervidicoccus fontis (strain DSM 19380 / JCM 18336 / VKM B-2539 / Kam940) TaxID=1163730 RepID=I0A0Z6_FERFK|nr:hypothetical protein FFONT_0664 [Fervidicoccus fontis Kam940]
MPNSSSFVIPPSRSFSVILRKVDPFENMFQGAHKLFEGQKEM